MITDRQGFALVLSMLLVMALAVMAAGILAVGTREAAVAAAVARRAQAVRTAEGAVMDALESWSTASLADPPIGGVVSLRDDPAATVSAVRADSGLYVVRAEGRTPGPWGPSRARAAVVVRTLEASRIARALPGAVTASGPVTLAGGSVVGGTAGPGPACEPGSPGVVADTVLVAPGASVAGDPAIDSTRGAPPASGTDPFGPAAVPALATIRYSGPTASPRAVAVAGECSIDDLNWGSVDPGHPCYDLMPVVSAADLVLDGGSARGVLVVDGDLRVRGGARLHGVAIVRGRLTVEEDSEIRGAVRTRSLELLDGAIIRDGCEVAEVVSAPALDRAFRPPDRWWIPAF